MIYLLYIIGCIFLYIQLMAFIFTIIDFYDGSIKTKKNLLYRLTPLSFLKDFISYIIFFIQKFIHNWKNLK